MGRRGRRRDDRARGAGAPLGRPLLTATWEARARLTRNGDAPGGPLGHAGRTCERRGATCVPQEEDRGGGLCGWGDGSRELQPNVHEDRPPRVGGGHIPRGARRADVSSPEAPPPAAVDAQAAPEKQGRGEPARAGAASRALHPSFVRSRDEALAQMARRGQLPALGAACGRSPRSLSRAPSVF